MSKKNDESIISELFPVVTGAVYDFPEYSDASVTCLNHTKTNANIG